MCVAAVYAVTKRKSKDTLPLLMSLKGFRGFGPTLREESRIRISFLGGVLGVRRAVQRAGDVI